MANAPCQTSGHQADVYTGVLDKTCGSGTDNFHETYILHDDTTHATNTSIFVSPTDLLALLVAEEGGHEVLREGRD